MKASRSWRLGARRRLCSHEQSPSIRQITRQRPWGASTDREARGFVRAPCPPSGCIPRAATLEGQLPFPAVLDEGAVLPVRKEVCLEGVNEEEW